MTSVQLRSHGLSLAPEDGDIFGHFYFFSPRLKRWHFPESLPTSKKQLVFQWRSMDIFLFLCRHKGATGNREFHFNEPKTATKTMGSRAFIKQRPICRLLGICFVFFGAPQAAVVVCSNDEMLIFLPRRNMFFIVFWWLLCRYLDPWKDLHDVAMLVVVVPAPHRITSHEWRGIPLNLLGGPSFPLSKYCLVANLNMFINLTRWETSRR